MSELVKVKEMLFNRGRVFGFRLDGSKENNKYVRVASLISSINLFLAFIQMIIYCITVRNDLMQCLIVGKKLNYEKFSFGSY